MVVFMGAPIIPNVSIRIPVDMLTTVDALPLLISLSYFSDL